MKKRNWKFILPPPVLAAFLFMACNLIQEMPKDFVETYGNIAYVESVEYVGLAEEGGDKPKVTETKNFKIIYHIKNDGDFDLSPEFSFEGCEIKNPHVDTGKKRVSLTIAGEELKALDNGKEFKVKLTLYKASQKVLQSSYEIGMRYVYTGGPETPKGTVEIKIPLSLPEGYELSVKDSTEFKAEKGEDGSWIITTIGSGVAEGKYELELVVKDEEGKEIGTIKKEIEVSAGNPTNDFTEKDDEKSLDEFIDEVEKKIDEIEKNPPKNPDDDDKGDDDKGGETKPETPLGKVEITIPVHGGYTLEIDGENKDKFEVVPNGDGSYTITTKEEGGVPTGKYELELVVKDEDENEVKSFNKTVEVSTEEPAGNFAGDDEPFEITEEMIEKTTVYVRGKDAAWYDVKHPDDAKASDDNSGARLKPFATIQKAVDTIIARNADDDSEPYTIYVDGTLTQNEAPSGNKKGMADFSELEKGLKLTIKSLSDTKATLDANKKSRVIYANPTSGALKLTLENLVITGGNTTTDNGGGIHFESASGALKISGNTEISGNTAKSGGGIFVPSGTFTMNSGTITGNTAADSGGGIYVLKNDLEAIFTMEGGTISGNKALFGSGVYNEKGTFTMIGGEISSNKEAQLGGGVYINGGTFTMDKKGTISGNSVSGKGGGVYVNDGTLTMKGGTINRNVAKNNDGGGVYVFNGGEFIMEGGIIGGTLDDDKNEAKYGGGVYIKNGAKVFKMSNGEISNNEANDQGGGVYVYSAKFEISGTAKISRNKATNSGGGIHIYKNGDSATLTMTGGEISSNTAKKGGGVYNQDGEFTMSGDKSKISGNISSGYSDTNTNSYGGGGVYVFGSNGTFIMSGGMINSNEAKSYGGGVHVENYGNFNMTGGSFKDNSAENGNGAYISYTGKFNMSDNAKFEENDDVRLHVDSDTLGFSIIHVNGNLNASTPVATITLPDSAYAAGTQVLSVDAGVTMDESLCNKLFSITPDNGTKWKISYDNSNGKGVLKKDTVSTGGDSGISVTLPDLGTYTVKVKYDDTYLITNGKELQSGHSIALSEVTDSNGNAPNAKKFTIEIRDEGENKLAYKTSDTITEARVTVPSNLPSNTPAKIYVKVELNDGNAINVINVPIPVTINKS